MRNCLLVLNVVWGVYIYIRTELLFITYTKIFSEGQVHPIHKCW